MPHRELSESSPGPEPLELRAEGGFGGLTRLDEGGDTWSDYNMAGGGGTLTEADSTSETNPTLASKVKGYADSIFDALDELEATDDASIREAIARKTTNVLGFLNAWMDHLYTHPAYKATETLRQEGLDSLLRFKNPKSVAEGITQMRQFIEAVYAIDFAKAVEVPYDKLYSSESSAAKAQRELYARPAEDLD